MSSGAMPPEPHDAVAAAIDELIDECRADMLWFLRPDYYPRTDDDRRRVLYEIQKHGTVELFQRAARLREWLSQRSSVASANS
jgi:hypothetical protein